LQRLKKGTLRSRPTLLCLLYQKSIKPDFMICLDDGRKLKSLTRHLRTLGMTPDQYRAKWGLPTSYPMVAPVPRQHLWRRFEVVI
jgi:predicted transcriptional regulator